MLEHMRPVIFVLALLFGRSRCSRDQGARLRCGHQSCPLVASAFTKETGDTVTFTFGSPGPVNARLDAGEAFDLVIAATEAAKAREALWKPGSRRPLVRVGIGVAVRDGVTVDLSTVESTRKALVWRVHSRSAIRARAADSADRTRSRCSRISASPIR